MDVHVKKTLTSILRRRGRLTELETACLLIQIIDALRYLHQRRIAARNLKMGHFLINDRMEVKLSGFREATKFRSGERRR
mmetsp:Transcript_23165/g.26240  ORF Transcript_23165/g.26240 Transcript_23165/m.26240 type:complete len:80 (-) Transcript_23165:610-849(-)